MEGTDDKGPLTSVDRPYPLAIPSDNCLKGFLVLSIFCESFGISKGVVKRDVRGEGNKVI